MGRTTRITIAKARERLVGVDATSTLADIESLLGAPTRVLEASILTYVFACDGGEVRVGSRDGSKLKFVRIFERPAGVPDGAELDASGTEYRRGPRNGAGLEHGEFEIYAATTGALLRRVTFRNGAEAPDPQTIEELALAIQEKKRGAIGKLLAAGTTVIGTYQGGTALHHLAEYLRDAELARKLIALGVDVNARDDGDRTPLYLAVEQARCRSDFLEALVDAGAELDARCAEFRKMTALQLACETQSGVMTDREEQLALWLVQRGANPDVRAIEGTNALTAAAQYSRLSVVQALIAAGATIQGGEAGFTPLHHAAHRDIDGLFEALIAAGNDIEARTLDDRLTPLHEAAKSSAAGVRRLLALGADPRAVDGNGRDALAIAREFRRDDVIAVLEGKPSPSKPAKRSPKRKQR